jgi:adenylyltransferase/sulfurtransferase
MPAPHWEITAPELEKSLKDVFLLDVREQEEYDEGHLNNCKLIPLGELSARAEKELDKSLDIVIYCAHGVRSQHALMALRSLGFENTRSLAGGIVAWDEYLQSKN